MSVDVSPRSYFDSDSDSDSLDGISLIFLAYNAKSVYPLTVSNDSS